MAKKIQDLEKKSRKPTSTGETQLTPTPRSDMAALTAVQLGHCAPQAPSPARQWASRLATDAELKEHIKMFKAELGERQRIRAAAKYWKKQGSEIGKAPSVSNGIENQPAAPVIP